jgi:hypothetical protein
MKWFKHDSDASNDAKLKKLRLKYGAQGYGIYWYCLELIARNVEKHNLTFELEHDAELIADDFKLSAELVQHIMTFMVDIGLFENTNGIISCLKMATRTDEYTQKLIQSVKKTPDNVPTLSVQNPTMSVLIEENRLEDKRKKDTTNKLSYELGYGWVNYQAFLEKAEVDFPYVDILKEFDKAGAWIKQKPSQRLKTDYNKFMLNWIKRVADVTPNPGDVFEGAI